MTQKNIPICLSAFLLLANWLPAQAIVNYDSAYSYQFHLYFTGSALTLNPDYKTPYDLTVHTYNPADGLAYGELYSDNGTVLVNFSFSLQRGPNTVEAPYVPAASKAVLFAQTASVVPLSIVIQKENVCNSNGACEIAAGESAQNCAADCGSGTVSSANPGSATTSATNQSSRLLLLGIVSFLFIGMVLVGIYYFIRRNHSNDA